MRLIQKIEADGQSLFRGRSYLPLLVLPLAVLAIIDGSALDSVLGERGEQLWLYLCLVISGAGIAIRAFTVGYVPGGTSGRTTSAPRAESLNTTGMYSIVRNPLYLGNFVVYLGIALATKSWWFVLLTGLAYWLYIERIIAAEEAFLATRFGETFERWAARTPVFFPRLSAWQSADARFSLRTVLRREYPGVLACAASFLALSIIEEVIVEAVPVRTWLTEGRVVVVVFVLALIVFFVLRTLKKRTRLLHVPGR
ncbi:MAG: isoprenylcysteine carboxylmethyltransferase family protein [Alphaproteobacteria bacterium]